MTIDYHALLHGRLMFSTAHGHDTNYYVINFLPVLVLLLIVALLMAATIALRKTDK